jgi:hypothetical protein
MGRGERDLCVGPYEWAVRWFGNDRVARATLSLRATVGNSVQSIRLSFRWWLMAGADLF